MGILKARIRNISIEMVDQYGVKPYLTGKIIVDVQHHIGTIVGNPVHFQGTSEANIAQLPADLQQRAAQLYQDIEQFVLANAVTK